MFRYFIATLLFSSTVSASDQPRIEGKVVSGGNAFNRSVSIVTADDRQERVGNICYDKQGKKVDKLTGMQLRVVGTWKEKGKKKKRKCFVVSEIEVLKVASGRKPLVGFLVKKEGKFFLNDIKGEMKELYKPSSQLQKFLGVKVIVDAIANESSDNSTYRVVSYLKFP